MDFHNVRDDVTRELQSNFNDMINRIRAGEDAEPIIRNFVGKIHEKWIEKSQEYARRVEEQRAIDRKDMEEKLKTMKEKFQQERHENQKIHAKFTLHLLKIEESHRNHKKFGEMKGEALIKSFGHYSTALRNLLARHEDLEFAGSGSVDQKNEGFIEARRQCQDIISEQYQEIQDILTNKISIAIPVESICKNRGTIQGEIQKIRGILYDLNSQISYLTPDCWDDENLKSINDLRADLESKTGNLLRMIGEGEASHKRFMDELMIFNADRAIGY